MKKAMTKMEKIRLKGWRARYWLTRIQIGQLLFYLVILQLKRIQHYLQPVKGNVITIPAMKALGVFMEEGKVIKLASECERPVLSDGWQSDR
jgi:hypothetical protein